MKYADFKSYLKVIGTNKTVLPEDNVLKLLLSQALKEVAIDAEPLLLNTKVKDKNIIKILEDGSYILAPVTPQSDDDLIIIDEELIYAVANTVLSKYCVPDLKKFYREEANSVINSYKWNRYRAIEYSLDDELTYTEIAIDVMGEKTIYISKTKTTNGYVYVWDDSFVSIVNDYLMGKSLTNISKSDRNNLDRLILFFNNEMNVDDKHYLDFVEFNKYLGGL